MLLHGEFGTLTSNTISQNSTVYDPGEGSGYEGGISIEDSEVELVGNVIDDNLAPFGDGGIEIYGSTVSLWNNLITNNRSDPSEGGGIGFYDNDYIEMVNNVIADNQSGYCGSGLYFDGNVATLSHNTIARNHGGAGVCLEYRTGSENTTR